MSASRVCIGSHNRSPSVELCFGSAEGSCSEVVLLGLPGLLMSQTNEMSQLSRRGVPLIHHVLTLFPDFLEGKLYCHPLRVYSEAQEVQCLCWFENSLYIDDNPQ